jgi:hypothetical protein
MNLIEQSLRETCKEAQKEIDRLRERCAELAARIEEIQKLYNSSAHRRATYHSLLCHIGRLIKEME